MNLTPSFRHLSLYSCFLASAAFAQTQDTATAMNSTSDSYFGDWFARVSKIQSEQPHWITPMTTVTPRLEEELRYDQSWENNSGTSRTANYGNGKGLELIPYENVEVILGIPNWEAHNKPTEADGFGDESFLVKYRIASANEDSGNYIVTTFLQLQHPRCFHPG
jgi:hypothetical protein